MNGQTKGFVVGLIVGVAAYHVFQSKGSAITGKSK
jgi:hypothetical protein